MTTPTTNKTAPKSTPTPKKDETVVVDEKTPLQDDVKVEETPKNRIPEYLANNPIFAEFCKRYLETFDDISKYNKSVLASKDSQWTTTKILEKAREMARPTEAGKEPNKNVLKALEDFERLINEMNVARRAVVDAASKELGISTVVTDARDPEKEAPLKEARKTAVELGKQLNLIADMTQDKKSSDEITKFLTDFPLPAIGRDQVHTFGGDTKATPKYRLSIKVAKGDEVLMEGEGITKTALALSNPKFGYERGKSLSADELRKAWESAGNSSENTVQPTVEFTDNGLTFTLTKK
jgi:hypothetical protein